MNERKKCNAMHGYIYQTKLINVILHIRISYSTSTLFNSLGTEIEEANAFDDLVFEYTKDNKKTYRLLQANKLKEHYKITKHELLSKKRLIKYFLSKI